MTENAHLATIGLPESQNELEERGFPGAVLAENADDIAPIHLEREIVKNPFGPE